VNLDNGYCPQVEATRKLESGDVPSPLGVADMGKMLNFQVINAGFYAFLLQKNYWWAETGIMGGLIDTLWG